MNGPFVNAMSPDSDSMRDQLKASLGPAKFERMVALKRKYDPENLFRLNYNIPPD
jgi:FAD/FMN-containing dehydrogenase